MNTIKSLLGQLGGLKAEARKDIENQLKTFFTDPFYIGNSESLSEYDPLKIEARIVSDAFEAVTNGMYNDETASLLEKIGPDSYFADWRYLTESLFHIYKNSFREAEEAIALIREDSVPALIVPVLRILSDRDFSKSVKSLSEAELSLVKDIARENLNLGENIKEALNNLEKRDEHGFTDIITLIITDTLPRDSETSATLAVWALRQFFAYDMSPEVFIENIRLVFGETETFRISALSLIDEDPELSLMFWLKTLISLLKKSGSDRVTVEAYIEIIDMMRKKVESENTFDADLSAQIENLYFVLNRELELRYQNIRVCESSSSLAEKEYGKAASDSPDKDKIVCKKAGNSLREKKGSKKPVQLELFA